MDMHAAYREVGSYRAAAEICGTTPKTVKRSVEAARAAGSGPVPGEVRHNYDGVAEEPDPLARTPILRRQSSQRGVHHAPSASAGVP